MNTKTHEEKLEALTLAMPKWDDFVVEEFKEDPEYAHFAIDSELKRYAETGDITFLLSTLKTAARAKGWVWLAKETGLSRPTLYETLNGTTRPRIDTLTKILRALGFKMLFVADDNIKPQSEPKTPPKRKAMIRRPKKKEATYA
ncbi:hypothetical protein AGMMS50276_32110 [Synergistales bacterium]|nr:hypothetical protein AGMMS50276_32110 [Synergistales bacterium]